MRVLLSDEMKNADLYTEEAFGISTDILMERAALSVVKHIRQYNPVKVLVVAGKGNNGGDGIAIARQLTECEGKPIAVDLLSVSNPDSYTGSCKKQYEIYSRLSGKTVESIIENEYDIIVDAILGIGMKGRLREREQRMIEQINAYRNHHNCRVISVDIPSGVCADTGQVGDVAIMADETVAFSCYKYGNLLYPGAGFSKKTYVENIGIPSKVYDEIQIDSNCTTTERNAPIHLPLRKKDGNKGTFGRVLVIAGSENMYGACYLSAMAAYRSGSGIVCVYSHPNNRELLMQMLPEAIFAEDADEDYNQNLLREILAAKSIVLGPGLGTESRAMKITEYVLLHAQCPVVIDADALNCISASKHLQDILKQQTDKKIVFTPHPLELSRLISVSTTDITQDYANIIRKTASQWGIVLVGKGAGTIVSDGNQTYINQTGNVGMATAGSGDVLSGIIGSLLARGLDCFTAAQNGVFIHGRCGDEALLKSNSYSLLARDLCDSLQTVLQLSDTPMSKDF